MRGAADAPGIEPSAISRRIQQMEGAPGVDPFERRGAASPRPTSRRWHATVARHA
ncbi:helix-turn-helix domain-containing protein [Achromobacter aloeverae]